jgi:hypothetical protein
MSLVRSITGIIGTLAFAILLFFSCWILTAGCSRAHVGVSNQSGTTVSNLLISGSCKERHADTLATQAEWRAVTPYQSGGSIHFSFESAGKGYDTNSEVRSGWLGLSYTIGTNMIISLREIH